jgi:MFS family permease
VASALGTTGALLVLFAPGPKTAIVGFALTGLGLPVVAPLCFSAASAAVRNEPHASPREEAVAVDSVVARLNIFNYLGSLAGAVLVGLVATVTNLRVGFIVPVLLASAVFTLARAFATAPARAAS